MSFAVSARRNSPSDAELAACTRALRLVSVQGKNINQLLNGGERVGPVHDALVRWEGQAFEDFPTTISGAQLGLYTIGEAGAFDALKATTKRYLGGAYSDGHSSLG